MNYAPRGHFPTLLPGSVLPEETAFITEVVAKDPDGSVASVSLKVDDVLISVDTTAPYEFEVPGLSPGLHQITATVIDNGGAVTDVVISIEIFDSGDIGLPLDRSSWVLTGSNNTEDLGNAIDGDIESRWTTRQSQRPGQQFNIDFGSRETFETIVLETPGDPNDYPRAYEVRGSDDGMNFTVLASNAGVSTPTTITLSEPVTYRYLEIEQTGTAGFNWWSIHEINIFQPSVNSALPLSSWLQLHFGDSPDALTADSDGDGLTTLEEYAFNADPTSASRGVLPVLKNEIVVIDGEDVIDYTFRRWADEEGRGVDYLIEVSGDLGSWDTIDASRAAFGDPVSNGDGTENVTASVELIDGSAKEFLRLKIEER